MRVWGAAVSALHLTLGALGWTLLGVAPWFFAGCAALTLAGSLLAAPLLRRPPGDDGRGGRGPDHPEPSPEPPWWPDFERDFRDHVRSLDVPPPRAIASRS